MKTRYIPILLPLLTALCLVSAPAYAGDPVISDISKNAYNVTKYLNKRGGPVVSAADAAKIKKAILANTLVDAGEAQMLDYLKSGQSFIIAAPSVGYSDVTFTKPVSAEAVAVLETIVSVSYDDPIEEQWMRGDAADLKALIAHHNSSDAGREKVLNIMAGSLKKASKQPQWEESKKQTKLELNRWNTKLYKLDGEEYVQFKAMLYEAAVIADKDGRDNTSGNILDFEYRHFGE